MTWVKRGDKRKSIIVKKRLNEWCFTSLSTVFQSYHSVISLLGFINTRLGLWSVWPKDTRTRNPKGSSATRTQDPGITSQTLYHWASRDPIIILRKFERASLLQQYYYESPKLNISSSLDYYLPINTYFDWPPVNSIYSMVLQPKMQQFRPRSTCMECRLAWVDILCTCINPLPYNTN